VQSHLLYHSVASCSQAPCSCTEICQTIVTVLKCPASCTCSPDAICAMFDRVPPVTRSACGVRIRSQCCCRWSNPTGEFTRVTQGLAVPREPVPQAELQTSTYRTAVSTLAAPQDSALCRHHLSLALKAFRTPQGVPSHQRKVQILADLVAVFPHTVAQALRHRPLSTLLESGLVMWQPLGPETPEEVSNSQQHCRTSGTGCELNPSTY
jgi:hypothetical protein